MACPATTHLDYQARKEGDSDYGSDFSPEEEELISRLLYISEREAEIEDVTVLTALEYHEPEQVIQVPQTFGRERIYGTIAESSRIAGDANLSNKAFHSEFPDLSHKKPKENEGDIGSRPLVDDKPDTRSPIERFRASPQKALSVTDLVSPAWCELQYWFALTTHGRKIPTKAMKEGRAMHKELEEQVYTTIKVDITTKEDAWGLRIWNVIQGLRTLEEIGYTRELEVWGIVDGFVVNGIIDEISFVCPDVELEAQLEKGQTAMKNWLPADQSTISDFFKASNSTSMADTTTGKIRDPLKKIYISDVKTRVTERLPNGAAFRPTKMQLMLYHHLLSNLATNQVDFSALLQRFDLDGEKPFSDSFIAQMGSLNDGIPAASLPFSNSDPGSSSSQDSLTLLVDHNSLRRLWSLMIKSFQELLPAGQGSIGNVLKAEYRSRDRGDILGSHTLAMDDAVLKAYLDHEMKWWKGEREPLGVIIEEAYKCKSCDFADICHWRRERVAEATEKARATKKALKELKTWEV